jgi:hypothetical protein
MKTQYYIKKTTLGDWNRGATSLTFTNLGNSRYKGTTTCWAIVSDECEIAALSRKSDAIKMAEFLNEINYDDIGDPVMMFLKHLARIEDWDRIDKVKEV